MPIEPALAIARDLVATPTNATTTGSAAAAGFIDFLENSPLADAAMELAGWSKESALELSSRPSVAVAVAAVKNATQSRR